MKDALGNRINVGDYVVYPGHQGSQTWMNLGRVTSLGDDGRVFVRKIRLGKSGDIACDGFTEKLSRLVVVDHIPLDLHEALA